MKTTGSTVARDAVGIGIPVNPMGYGMIIETVVNPHRPAVGIR